MKATLELSGDDDRVFDRLSEVRAALDLRCDRLDDLRVRVPDDHDPEPVMEVDVFVAVDVPDPAPVPAVYEDGLRRGILEGGGDAPREDLPCLGPELV